MELNEKPPKRFGFFVTILIVYLYSILVQIFVTIYAAGLEKSVSFISGLFRLLYENGLGAFLSNYSLGIFTMFAKLAGAGSIGFVIVFLILTFTNFKRSFIDFMIAFGIITLLGGLQMAGS